MPLGGGEQTASGMVKAAALSTAPAAPITTPAGFNAVGFLTLLLDNISCVDAEGFFCAPVLEEDYQAIIKRPMCFQRMKAKVCLDMVKPAAGPTQPCSRCVRA